MARRLKLLIEASPQAPDEALSLEWAAQLLGYDSFQQAKQSGSARASEPFVIQAGEARSKSGLFSGPTYHPWFLSETQLLEHEFLQGSTGAGKTEALLSRLSAVAHASPDIGLVYMDGKGEGSLIYKLHALARKTGRLEDLRCVNFMGGSALSSSQGRGLSHSFNPIEDFSAGMIASWLWGCFSDEALASSGLQGLEGGADTLRSFFEAASSAFVDLLHAGLADPGIAGLSPCLSYARLKELARGEAMSQMSKALIARYQAALGLSGAGLSAGISEALSAMLPVELSVSGGLESLSQAYGHIFNSKKNARGEWLASDASPFAPFEGGWAIVVLPALEKAPNELGLLGRMLVCSYEQAQKAMEPGAYRRLSAVVVLDEFGYYAPSSLGDFLSDAKRAGTAVALASQDIQSVWRDAKTQKARERALGWVESAGIKTFMKCEDPSGENLRFIARAFKGYQPPELWDLKDQREGDAWVAGAGAPVRARLHYDGSLGADRGPFELSWVGERALALPKRAL